MILILASGGLVAVLIAASFLLGMPDFSLVRHWQEWRAERKAERLVREARRDGKA